MWTEVLTVLVVIVLGLVWKVRRIYKTWEGYGIPHHGFKAYMSHMSELSKKAFPQVVKEEYEKHGRILGTFQMLTPTFIIGDPEILKQIMVKEFSAFHERIDMGKTGHKYLDRMVSNLMGQEWKDTRDVITPAFTASKMRLMVKTISEISDYAVENFLEAAKKKEDILLKDYFGAYTLDKIARLAFAVNVNSQKDTDSVFARYAEEVFGEKNSWRLVFFSMFPLLSKLLGIRFMPEEHTQFFATVIKKVIQERLHTKNDEAIDMLQLLLNARKQEQSEKATTEGKGKYKEVLTMDSIIAQCILFFVAGFHTTGTALTVAAYYLAINPEKQERLLEEIDEVPDTGELDYDVVMKLPYLDAVLNEAMRLQPPTGLALRVCTRDTEIKGIKFKRGMRVIIPLFGMHYDPEFFPEPEMFKPERFLPENKDSLIPYSFLPFGEGPRNCIGMKLALLGMKAVYLKLLRRVKFVKCDKTPIPLKLVPKAALLHFDPPIYVKAVERNK